jgi:hypothetical protein
MTLGIRVAYFCVGAAIAATLGGGVALVLSNHVEVSEALAALPDVFLFAVVLGCLSMLTSWIGFAFAQRLRHKPSRYGSLYIGGVFGALAVGIVALVGRNFLHAFSTYIVLILVIVGAPVVAFLGSMCVQRPSDV